MNVDISLGGGRDTDMGHSLSAVLGVLSSSVVKVDARKATNVSSYMILES